MKRGAGRVEEMLGYSPPDRSAAPPQWVKRYDLLIHVDRMEDWTPRTPPSSHSGQSGLPSFDSNDGEPLPRISPGTWTAHVEDGQGRGRGTAPTVLSSGCRGFPMGGPRQDGDHDDNSNGRRSWRDTLLGHGRADKGKEKASNAEPSRRRNRTPVAWHHGGGARGHSNIRHVHEPAAIKATPRFHYGKLPRRLHQLKTRWPLSSQTRRCQPPQR